MPFPLLPNQATSAFTGTANFSGSGTLAKIYKAGYEGQTNATNVSSSNSDDFGDDALSALNTGTGGTIRYSTTQAWHGVNSVEFASSTTSYSITYNTAVSDTSFTTRVYVYLAAYPATERQGPVSIRDASNANTCRLQCPTNGRLKIVDNSGSGVVQLATAIPLTTWMRLEFTGSNCNTTSSVLTLSVYAGDSTTPVETITTSAATTITIPSLMVLGWPSSSAAHTAYFDDIAVAVGRSAPLGPEPANAFFTGSGSLTLAGTPAVPGSGAFSGSGTMSTAGTPAILGSVALSGAGSLTLAGKPAITGPLTLSGAGTLTFAGTPAIPGSLGLSGSGTLTGASPLITASGSAAFTGDGTLTGLSGGFTGSLGLSGAGTLSFSGSPKPIQTLTLSGVGALTTAGIPSPSGILSLSGSGSLVPSAFTPKLITAVGYSGVGTLAGAGIAGFAGSLSLSGTGILSFASNVAMTGFAVAGVGTAVTASAGTGTAVTATSGSKGAVLTAVGGS